MFPERFLQKDKRNGVRPSIRWFDYLLIDPQTYSRIKLASPSKMSAFRQPMLLLDRSLPETGERPSINTDNRGDALETRIKSGSGWFPKRPEVLRGVRRTMDTLANVSWV